MYLGTGNHGTADAVNVDNDVSGVPRAVIYRVTQYLAAAATTLPRLLLRESCSRDCATRSSSMRSTLTTPENIPPHPESHTNLAHDSVEKLYTGDFEFDESLM